MNTRTIRGKSLGIFLSLALVLSMVAVVLPVQPVKAACTSVVINSPITGTPEYAKTGGTIPINYTVNGDGAAENVEIFIKNATTTIGWSGILSRVSAATYTDTITIPTATAGSYDVYITVNAGACTDTEANAVVIDNTPPTVTIVTPNGGGCYQGASAQPVTWIATDASPGMIDIWSEYTTNAGSSWSNVQAYTSYTQGSNSYSWTTPATSSTTCKVRITARDAAGNVTTTPVSSASYFTIIAAANPPTIAVQAPNGGETLYGGDTYTISWNAQSAYSSALDYYIEFDDGGGYDPVTTSWLISQPTGDRTYAWTVPHVSSTTCLVKVTARDCAGNTNSDASDAVFTIGDDTPPTVTVTAPTTGDNWYVSSSKTIRFSATDLVSGSFNSISLWLSRDGGATWPESITYGGTLAQGNKTQAWTVTAPTSTNCKIKACVKDAALNETCGISGTFTITQDSNPPTVTLCTPNGGEIWQAGTTQTITWTANDTPDAGAKMTYTLYLSTNGGSTYPTTIATLPNQDQCSSCTCSYSWAVPDSVGTDCKVKVEAKDPANNTATDESDAVFEITAAACAVQTSSITLQSGWNLISLELVPTSTNINTLLSSVLPNVLSVWYYSGGTSGSWSSYAPGAPSSLTTMQDGNAYWVNMATGGPFNMTYQGRTCPCPPSPPPTYSYGTGWYLVGFKSTVNKTVTVYLDSQCGTINAKIVSPITSWNAVGQTWSSKNCGDNMTSGKGYWVYFTLSHMVSPGCD